MAVNPIAKIKELLAFMNGHCRRLHTEDCAKWQLIKCNCGADWVNNEIDRHIKEHNAL